MAYPATSVASVLQAQLDVNANNIKIPQEANGILASVNTNFNANQAILNQDVVIPVVLPTASTAFTPANVVPTGSALSSKNRRIKLTEAKEQSCVLTGEDIKALEDINVKQNLLSQWLGQAQRTFRNEIDAAVAAVMVKNAGSASGTFGSLPFGSDLKDLTAARKIMRQNGVPFSDVNVVANLSAYENILNLGIISKANEAGNDSERRTGLVMGQYSTRSIVEDAFMADHTAGTATTAALDGNHALGATTLKVKSNDGTIKAGDIITIVGDTTRYVVGQPLGTTPSVDPAFTVLDSATGNIYINIGLKKAIAGDAVITIEKDTSSIEGVTGYSPNFVFEKSAVVLAVRPPVLGNSPFYSVHSLVTDNFGLSYVFIESIQDGQTSWFLRTLYGAAVIQPEFVHVIVG